MQQWLSKFWHEVLGRPYRLAAPINEGKGQVVVLLHGIASNHRVWGFVLPHIIGGTRVIALDLLGFGDSPKPKHVQYTSEDHAKAIIYTLNRMGVSKNAIFVGHSMGSLVAVEVAKRRPKLVKRLILCGMPVYRFDAKRRRLPNQESMYIRLYGRMLKERFAMRTLNGFKRLRPDLEGFGVDRQNYYAFQRSLENTIMKQTTFDDIQKVKVPVHMVGGRLDAFIIRRHLQALVKLMKGSSVQILNEPHEITERSGIYIGEVINAAVKNRPIRLEALPKKRMNGFAATITLRGLRRKREQSSPAQG